MAKFILFDGSFHEIDVLWLEEWKEGENWEDWLPRNGFSTDDQWNLWERDLLQDMSLRAIEIYAHKESPRWIVCVSSGGDVFDFAIEGRLNYLKFLSSPLCATIDLREAVGVLQAVAERAFRVWHGHDAPMYPEDHTENHACAECDPFFEETRRGEREQRRKRNQARRWAAGRRAELTAKKPPEPRE